MEAIPHTLTLLLKRNLFSNRQLSHLHAPILSQLLLRHIKNAPERTTLISKDSTSVSFGLAFEDGGCYLAL